MLHAIKELWPDDVGTTEESRGPAMRFLQTMIIVQGRSLLISNWKFALGNDEFQKVARLGCCSDSNAWQYFHLRRFIVQQFVLMSQILGGADADDAGIGDCEDLNSQG